VESRIKVRLLIMNPARLRLSSEKSSEKAQPELRSLKGCYKKSKQKIQYGNKKRSNG